MMYDYDVPHSKMSTLVIFSFLSFALFLGFSVAIHLQPVLTLGISAVGDWGCSSNTQQTVNNIKNKNPQLVLALGDYSYQGTAKCWLDKVKPIDSKTKINIGNHEVVLRNCSIHIWTISNFQNSTILLISIKFMFLLCLQKQVSNQIRHSSNLLIVISKKHQRILA